MDTHYEMIPLGDAAVVIRLGTKIDSDTHQRVSAVAHLLQRSNLTGVSSVIPSYASVTVYYRPLEVFQSQKVRQRDAKSAYELLAEQLHSVLETVSIKEELASRRVTIPVCYGGEWGPDLEEVAAFTGKSPEEVIQIHTGQTYLVYMIGFAPGFPYLGGMPDSIAMPRRQSPRLSIPAGSVGIAEGQTGVYPIETPGGWQLIGRTPLSLFTPEKDPPSLLQAGDRVQFYSISSKEYADFLGGSL